MVHTSRRRGFTIIELFIVVAILGILAALAVPAVWRVRLAVHRISCANNMRILGFGAQQYQTKFGKIPPGCVMPYATRATPPSIADASGIPPPELLYELTLLDSPARRNSDPIRYPFGPNWAVYLLPYVGQEPLYAQARVFDYQTGYRNGNDALRDRWRAVVKDKTVPAYLCPADIGNGTPFQGYTHSNGSWARGNYAGNAGPGWWQMSLDGRSYKEAYGKTGPVFGINYGAVLQKLPDGMNATILFTELRIGASAADPRGVWALGYPGSSITAANAISDCPTPNDNNETSDDVQGCPEFYYHGIGTRDRMGCSRGFANLGWPSWQAQSRSQHSGGVNVCFADGSVRFISNTIDQGIWFSLLSANDGRTVQYPGE